MNVVYDVIFRRLSGKQLRPDINPLWCSVWLVDGMLRAGSHDNNYASVDPRGCPVSDRPKCTRKEWTSHWRTPPEQT